MDDRRRGQDVFGELEKKSGLLKNLRYLTVSEPGPRLNCGGKSRVVHHEVDEPTYDWEYTILFNSSFTAETGCGRERPFLEHTRVSMTEKLWEESRPVDQQRFNGVDRPPLGNFPRWMSPVRPDLYYRFRTEIPLCAILLVP